MARPRRGVLRSTLRCIRRSAQYPNERLAEERRFLNALPSLRPQIGAGSVRRKVDSLSCIRYGSARYSVPKRLVGTSVAVVVDHGALILLEPATGVIVAEHELVSPGEVSILDEHYGLFVIQSALTSACRAPLCSSERQR